jgi:acyl-coenzyme A thioesterase PaaI-like protein
MTATGCTDEPPSVQERLYPQLRCFGCGPSNSKGLQLRSYEREDAVVADFAPWPEHDNGLGYLNGGIIAMLLDCHSAAAVFLEAERNGWTALPGAALPYVTAGLDVRFLRPAPLHHAVQLRARVLGASESEITAEAHLVADASLRASAVATWRRWRPRHQQTGTGPHQPSSTTT